MKALVVATTLLTLFHAPLLGNIAEWTSSGTGPYPAGPVTDPQGTDSETKITRGNGWVSSYDWIRPAARSNQPVDKSKSTIGFRVLCEAK